MPPIQLGSSFFTELHLGCGKLQLVINILGTKKQEKEQHGLGKAFPRNFFDEKKQELKVCKSSESP